MTNRLSAANLVARSAAFARAQRNPRLSPSSSSIIAAGSPRLAFPRRIPAPAERVSGVFRLLERPSLGRSRSPKSAVFNHDRPTPLVLRAGVREPQGSETTLQRKWSKE